MDASVTANEAPSSPCEACARPTTRAASGSLVVLDNVDLTLRSGEIVGLLGRSGCGKSTLLRAIAGLIRPTEGTITFDGYARYRPARGHRVGVPELCALSLAHRSAECGTRPRSSRPRARRAPQARPGRDRPDRPRRLRERLSQGTLGRHAPARRICARARRASEGAADGRALFGPRRADRRDLAHRSARSVVRGPHADRGHPDGDPQYRGGGADVRPHSHFRVESRACHRRNPGRPATAAQPPRSGVSGRSWTTSMHA